MFDPSIELPGERKDLKCPEPDCPGTLVLKESRYGHFYGCNKWSYNQCPGAHGAHPDGSPMGVPAPKETRRARTLTHEKFDRLWKEGHLSRRQAYRWLQRAMKMTEEQAHIGRFTIEQCRTLYRLLLDRSPAEIKTEAESADRQLHERIGRNHRRNVKNRERKKRARARRKAREDRCR